MLKEVFSSGVIKLPPSFSKMYRGRGDDKVKTLSPVEQWQKAHTRYDKEGKVTRTAPPVPVIVKEIDGKKTQLWLNRSQRRAMAARKDV